MQSLHSLLNIFDYFIVGAKFYSLVFIPILVHWCYELPMRNSFVLISAWVLCGFKLNLHEINEFCFTS